MHENETLIENFYNAFATLDAPTMLAAYHEDIEFSDPVFQSLKGDQAGKMWTMLCAQAKDFELEFRDITADDKVGCAHWEASYTFSLTGRRVHNVIDASFHFKDAKIVKHEDSFDFRRWCSMALGPMGILLGWTPFLQNKIRRSAEENLMKFKAK